MTCPLCAWVPGSSSSSSLVMHPVHASSSCLTPYTASAAIPMVPVQKRTPERVAKQSEQLFFASSSTVSS